MLISPLFILLLLLSLLLHCLVVDVAALHFVGPSTLVYSLTSNSFLFNFIFLLFSIFCLPSHTFTPEMPQRLLDISTALNVFFYTNSLISFQLTFLRLRIIWDFVHFAERCFIFVCTVRQRIAYGQHKAKQS